MPQIRKIKFLTNYITLFLSNIYGNLASYPTTYCFSEHSYTNVPSYRTAESIGMHFDREYPDEANTLTHVSVIFRDEWVKSLSE